MSTSNTETSISIDTNHPDTIDTNTYVSNVFSNFSTMQQDNYETKLHPEDEVKFQEWKKTNAPNDSGYDYDLRGAYMHGMQADPNADNHWPDTFKKPWHPTFSTQSIYAADHPELAGTWDENNQYVPSPNRPVHINTNEVIDASSVQSSSSTFNMEDFRYTDQQRLEESFNALKKEIPKEHHGVLKSFWDNVLGPTIAQGIINPLMDPTTILMGKMGGRGRLGGAPRKLPEIQFPSELNITKAEPGSYSGSYYGTETMPQQQQAFFTYSKASGLDSNKMLEAMAMKDKGASPDKIYKATGAEFYEGKWGERVPYSNIELKVKPDFHERFTVNDKGEFVPENKQDAFYSIPNKMPLEQVIHDHPIFKADPTTRKIWVRSMTPSEQNRYSENTFGVAIVEDNTIALRPGLSEERFKTAIAHEVDHVIQFRHGLPQGSASEMFRDSAYRAAEAEKMQSYEDLRSKVNILQRQGQANYVPAVTDPETAKYLANIVNKGQNTPKYLTHDEKTIYNDIVKNGLEKDIANFDEKAFRVLLKDQANNQKYHKTKGEVASRVGEAEVGKTAEEVAKKSYLKTLEAEVSAKNRIDSPLDVGFPTSQFGFGVYKFNGHSLTETQAHKLYSTRPDLRPVPPGYTQEQITSLNAKQYLKLTDYLSNDSTYTIWRRSGGEGNFPNSPHLRSFYKKHGIKEDF